MSTVSAQHASFTIDRNFEASVARIYAAFSTQEGKARWFGGGPTWEAIERRFDFRVGGREYAHGRWRGERGDAETIFDCLYHDIVPEQRIVYSYDLHYNHRKLSVSLATIEFSAAGARTQMKLTEQGVFLDGYDDAGSRERGTRELMDRLAASLGNH